MANDTRIILEFVGDPRGLKPAADALRAIGSLTKEQIAEFEKANAEFAKRSKDIKKQTDETKKLTDETKKSGTAVDQLSRKTKAIPSQIKKGSEAMKGIKKEASSVLSVFKNIAGTLGIAFGVQQFIQLGKEMVMVAAKGEGIRKAFAKINDPNLLRDLRAATRSTVTDIELMQSALRAKNFQVPLEKLATFFEFATKRSIETGESVDYLVNSIVDGIGRKSTLVLDNLGISATELQAEIKKTGDFGEAAANIISRGLAETGDVADTTAVKIAQLNTAWENFKERSGGVLINITTAFLDSVDLINKNQAAIDKFYLSLKNVPLNEIEALIGKQGEVEQNLREARKAGSITWSELNEQLRTAGEEFEVLLQKYKELRIQDFDNSSILKLDEIIEGQTAKIKELQRVRKEASGSDRDNVTKQIRLETELLEIFEKQKEARLDATGDDLDAFTPDQIDAMLKAYKGMDDAQKKNIVTVATLREEIKQLTEEFENSEVGGKQFNNVAEQIRIKAEQLKKALDALKESAEKLDKSQNKVTPIPVKDGSGTRFGENNQFRFVTQGDVIQVENLNNSLAGLNTLLSEARENLSVAGEFTDEYDKWEQEVERLEKRIETFGDKVIKTNEKISTSSVDTAKGFDMAWTDTFNQITSGFSSMFNSIATIQNNALEYEMQALEAQLKTNAISREEYEKERARLASQAAQNAKDQALFNAIINTAQAVVTALATPGVPFPVALGFSLLAGAAGAAQIAAIASKPVPKFAKGTKKAPKGFKWVGEEGPELTYDSGGYPIITNQESQIISTNPWSTDAQEIMKKYDIPRLDVGLFNQPLRITEEAYSTGLRNNRERKGDFADNVANSLLMNGSGDIVRALRDNQRTDRYGYRRLEAAINKRHNDRAGW